MRRIVTVAFFVVSIGLASVAAPAWAASNPNGTGPPNQSCQAIEANGGTTPGHASSSPGSPFNEPGINSTNGGTGGQHYSPKSQYDVACYQEAYRKLSLKK